MTNKARKSSSNLKTEEFSIKGMECGSCEKIIEEQGKSIDGVIQLKTDYVKGVGTVTYDPTKANLKQIFGRINTKGYSCEAPGKTQAKTGKLNYITLALGAIVLLAGAYILSGFTASMPNLDQNTSLILLFTVGLLTGFHCVAMCGGFVVSYTTKNAMKQGGLNLGSHMSYGFGKTLSYAIIGAFFGFIGSLITFTPFMRGLAALLAGVFLIMFGLNMLDLFTWFRRFRLKTPGFVGRITGRYSSSPLVIGLLNGLMIACGPLQAVYIFAAASGSPYYGALYLAVFGLGTLPVLLGFGVLTSILSSQLTSRIVRYSGVLVILLGLIMLNRGIALAGLGYDVNTLLVSAQGVGLNSPVISDIVASGVSGVSSSYQEIHMNVTSYGWQPDTFVLRKGVPVRWIIDGQQITNCNRAIQVPKLGLEFNIKKGLQTIEFTPTEAGVIPWSCWMGMIQGTFIVKDNVPAAQGVNVNEQRVTSTTVASTTTTTLAISKSTAGSVGYQEIHMNVTASGWQPSKFVLKKGVPVKWIIDGQELTGCNSAIKVPSLGLSFDIKPGLQTIEFTPTDSGNIPWSCWMGMIKGVFVVKDDVNVNDPAVIQQELSSVQVPSGGGGCGCGGMMKTF